MTWLLATAKECEKDITGMQFIWIILGICTFTGCLTWLIFRRRGAWWHAVIALLGMFAAIASIGWGIYLSAAGK